MRRAAVALVAVAALTACTDVPTSEQAVELEPVTPQAADPTAGHLEHTAAAQAEHDQLVAERARAAARAARAARTTTRPRPPRTTTTSTPPAPPAPSGDGPWGPRTAANCGGWAPLVAEFFPAEIERACRVLWCESKGNPNATNGRYRGLFQIAHGSYEPRTNVRHAAEMAYTTPNSWGHWSCR